MMTYYLDENGNVFAYSEDQIAAGYPGGQMKEMTQAEVDTRLGPVAPPLSREQVEALRLRAYADPLSGSDRHFSEAARMQAMSEAGWESAHSLGVARFSEIKSEYPWP